MVGMAKWPKFINPIGSHSEMLIMSKTNETIDQMAELKIAMANAMANDNMVDVANIGMQIKKLNATIAIESENAESGKRDALRGDIELALETFVDRINELSSVKMVSMSIDGENGVVVNLKTKSASGGNGGGGNGVGMVKDGEWFKLGTIFENHATPEDVAEYNAETSGTKKWNIRRRVAKLNGYTIAK
jgi:hypothetical protein